MFVRIQTGSFSGFSQQFLDDFCNILSSQGPVRGPTTRNSGAISQGIYEWEPDETLFHNRDLNKPPRPPKLRPTHQFERRNTTDGIGLAPRFRLVQSGDGLIGVPMSPMPLDPILLKSAQDRGIDIAAIDDSYANYESIYSNQKRKSLDNSVEVEKPCKTDTELDTQGIANQLASTLLPTPLNINSTVTGAPIYRTEVRFWVFFMMSLLKRL